MFSTKYALALGLMMAGVTAPAYVRADTRGAKPLSESDVLKLVELQRDVNMGIVARLKNAGVDFEVNDALIERMRKAGASEEVLAALEALKKGPRSSIRTITLAAKLGQLSCLAFSPDGKTLALGGDGPNVELWRVGKSTRLVLKDHPGRINCLAFSPHGKTLAVGSYKHVKLWDATTGKELDTLKGHTTDLQIMHFLPGGKTLVTASRAEAKRWQIGSDADPITTNRHGQTGYWVISPDGKRLAKCNGYWNDIGLVGGERWETDRLIRCSGTHSLAFSADGLTLAAGTKEHVRLFNPATGEQLAAHDLHTKNVLSVALAPDSKTVVSGSEDRTAVLWDVSKKKERATLKGHKGNVVARYCRDGKMVFTWCAHDETVRLWDVATGKEVGAVTETERITLAGVSPDGKTLATTGRNGIVRLRSIDTILRAGK
jgi:WD40 repeat protein